MTASNRPAGAAARSRRSKTVWPVVFVVLVVLTLLALLAFAVGWIDLGAADSAPGA